jgi:hypothetical protein
VGWLPPLTALGLYNAWFFGRPWRFAYASYINLPEAAPTVGWAVPDPSVLFNSLVHQREGLLLYSPFLALAVVGLAVAWRAGHRLSAAVVAGFAVLLWALSAAWLARFPSSFTGARYLFPVVPLLAAFAAPGLDRVRAGVRHALGITSVGLTYLTVQAGHIADPAPLLYAVKTFVSSAGLPVLIKEILPAALGVETLHTTLARADVTVRDLAPLLATPAGWQLALNQALVILLGAAVFASLAAVVHRLWARATVAGAIAPPALAR